jgi:hypothetical protein
MSFIPALCLSCSRVTLVLLADAQRSGLVCRACGADARVVPGCSFSIDDREQFEELSEIVWHAKITPMEAQSYAIEAERALWSGRYAPTLEKLTGRLLGLLPLHLAIGRNFEAQRRILIKLRTIFDALATARRGSAEYPITPNVTPARAGNT